MPSSIDKPVSSASAASARELVESEPTGRDRAAITETITTIAASADVHAWAQVRAAFADVVLLDYGTPERLSSDAIIARWRPLLQAFDATQHQLRGVTVRVTGDSATASASFQATHSMGHAIWILTGQYEYALQRSPLGWVVTATRMIPASSSGDTSLLARAQAMARGSQPPEAEAAHERDVIAAATVR